MSETAKKADEIAQTTRKEAFELEASASKLLWDVVYAKAWKGAKIAGIALISCVFLKTLYFWRYSSA